MERTGHRSEKDRVPEWNKRDDREKHKEKDVKNMSIAYGIKGKTAEEEKAYSKRKIWSREKKEQERGL